ncbi:hypothetical protein JCM8547_005843 [Rhodosporidiobolus lusitaniae]
MSAIFDGTLTASGSTAASTSSNNAPSSAGRSRKAAATKTACSRCRSIKVRCQAQEGGTNGKCVRCNRLNYECEWVLGQKRGRKPAVRGVEAADANKANPVAAATSTSTSHSQQRSSPSDPDPQVDSLSLLASIANPQPPTIPLPGELPRTLSAFPPSFHCAQPEASTSSQPFNFSSNTTFFPGSAQLPEAPLPRVSPRASGSISGEGTTYDTPSSVGDTSRQSAQQNLSMTDLAAAKVAALQGIVAETFPRPPPKQQAVVPSREPDPIDMHVVSEVQAVQLFEHYHSKMNGFIILLDPFLHTVDYVRANSTVLFTSVLAVSAKFLRPDLYPALLSSAKHLSGRCIIDGKVSLGLVQSLLLLVYWKEPEDATAWLRVGEACRMGYQLHLHDYRTTALPDNEREAREIMDRERTWIDLCAFDRTFFLSGNDEDDGYHQTCMIPHFRIDVSAWLEETRKYGVEDDLEQGADFEWMRILRMSKDIARARPTNARHMAEHVQGLLDTLYQRYLDPSSPLAFAVGSRKWIRVNFWFAAASVAFSRSILTACGISDENLSPWLVASSAFVEAFEIVARHGYISYWQDTLGITLFAMGEYCIFSKVYPTNQRAMLGWMERIYRACELHSDGRADSTAAYICRFFQSCIRIVCSPTTTPEGAAAAAGVASMPPPPILPQDPNAVDLSASFLLEGTDSSYWESLLPGTDWSWLDQPFNDLTKAL